MGPSVANAWRRPPHLTKTKAHHEEISGLNGTDLGFGSIFNHLVSGARGSCSPPVDETVYFSVLFSKKTIV